MTWPPHLDKTANFRSKSQLQTSYFNLTYVLFTIITFNGQFQSNGSHFLIIKKFTGRWEKKKRERERMLKNNFNFLPLYWYTTTQVNAVNEFNGSNGVIIQSWVTVNGKDKANIIMWYWQRGLYGCLGGSTRNMFKNSTWPFSIQINSYNKLTSFFLCDISFKIIEILLRHFRFLSHYLNIELNPRHFIIIVPGSSPLCSPSPP